jgi:hypothetical protein
MSRRRLPAPGSAPLFATVSGTTVATESLVESAKRWDAPAARAAASQEPASKYHCPKCGSELEAIAPSIEPPWPYEGIELACPKCEGPLKLIDIVRGWYRRVS